MYLVGNLCGGCVAHLCQMQNAALHLFGQPLLGVCPKLFVEFFAELIPCKSREGKQFLYSPCDSGGIDAAASLYCVFPLESSAMRNKKAVLCTASFVI